MPDAPAFSAAGSTAWLHYALVEAGAGARVTRRILWLAPEGKEVPVTVTLGESWAAGGVYFFLGGSSLTDRALHAALRRWLSGASEATRFVWVPAPSAPPAEWAAQVLWARSTDETGGEVLAASAIGAGGYAAKLERGGGISFSAETGIFSFDGPLCLQIPEDEKGLSIAGVELPIRGPSAGALTFPLDLSQVDGGPDPLTGLDAGLRFYHPTSPPASRGQSGVGTIRYPVLDLAETPIRFDAVIDPADPLGGRSGLTFAPDTPPIASCFRTVQGGRLTLGPLEGAGYQFSPLGPRRHVPEALTLTPVGRFAVGSDVPGAKLLCGTSGVEYVQLPAEGATLHFIPGCPAWAPLFVAPGQEAAAAGTTEAPRLDATAITSWIAISAPETLPYFAQPRDAVLHTLGADGLLEYFDVQAGSLPAEIESGEAAALPIVPYGGMEPGTHESAAAFEVEVLAPERRERVHGLSASEHPRLLGTGDDPETVAAITPGGYLATFSPDRTVWHTLRLAGLGGEELVLEDIGGPLRSALLTDSQFLVISNPASIAPHLDRQARLIVDGWTFDLHPPQWERHGTILIMKGCDRSLGDLVEDVGAWVLPEAFNRSPALAQRELESIIADARVRADAEDERSPDGQKPWRAFVRNVVDDPKWNGWLALRCPVPPDSLPPDLAQLAAGIDERRFYGHHLGMRQSPISRPDAAPPDSTLFALIAYDHLPETAQCGAIDFQVTSVRVSFAASRVQSFSAQIALTLGTIFGARAKVHGTTEPPTLLLDGALQRRGDHDVYVFRNRSETDLDLDDLTLRSVLIDRCELGSAGSTRPSDEGAGAEDVVLTRFTLRGRLGFSPLPASDGGTLDLFGYERLPFTGLHLEMRIPEEAPSAKRFRFDLSEVAFDSGSALARPGSLPDRFPLQPRGMISSDVAKTPGELGFSPLIVPALDAAAPAAEWVGLSFDLDLGTPGALADAVGLTAGFALVWSPSPRKAAAMVGLRLPGASNGTPGVSLMGVLDLRVHQQQLLAVDGAYLLKLTGITLNLLGRALPPDGTFAILLFGDPGGKAGGGPLGWYGAYSRPRTESTDDEDEDDKDLPVPPLMALAPSAGGKQRIPASKELHALFERGGDSAPPPAWLGRPWAWTLIQPTEE